MATNKLRIIIFPNYEIEAGRLVCAELLKFAANSFPVSCLEHCSNLIWTVIIGQRECCPNAFGRNGR